MRHFEYDGIDLTFPDEVTFDGLRDDLREKALKTVARNLELKSGPPRADGKRETRYRVITDLLHYVTTPMLMANRSPIEIADVLFVGEVSIKFIAQAETHKGKGEVRTQRMYDRNKYSLESPVPLFATGCVRLRKEPALVDEDSLREWAAIYERNPIVYQRPQRGRRNRLPVATSTAIGQRRSGSRASPTPPPTPSPTPEPEVEFESRATPPPPVPPPPIATTPPRYSLPKLYEMFCGWRDSRASGNATNADIFEEAIVSYLESNGRAAVDGRGFE